MTVSRTSIKDVMAAIEAASEKQTTSIDKLIAVMTASAMTGAAPQMSETLPVLDNAVPETPPKVEVDAAYLTHQQGKAQLHATDKGEDVVVYARRNGRGETKVAYALLSRFQFTIEKQPSCLGAISQHSPS